MRALALSSKVNSIGFFSATRCCRSRRSTTDTIGGTLHESPQLRFESASERVAERRVEPWILEPEAGLLEAGRRHMLSGEQHLVREFPEGEPRRRSR